MARKNTTLTIDAEGRDKGKSFVLTEMPVRQAEKWAMRALLAVAKSGFDIGDAAKMGMQGIAVMGIQAIVNMDWEDAEPLLDEMMQCVRIKETSGVRDIIGDDIEEVATLIQLRKSVLELHIDFSTAVSASK